MTRVWHWIFVVAVSGSWLFGKFMSSDSVLWHFYLGYTIVALLLFRLIWGMVGPDPVRLRALFSRPSEVIAYSKTLMKRTPSGYAGHNPMGSLWIVVVLLILLLQAISGLFIDADDFFEYGPLFDYVSEDTAKFFNRWHYYLSYLILGLVSLHVFVLFFYLFWKRENLISPMFSGLKWVKKA
ncbi:MAG: cytochrome b/b6 domain-containing protein [Gammaproteobacteria bacterium]|nr:cytochrome b/b6 domain-containing protein [Gammaproteobacteria bacterium]MDH5801532.1 cytochrome b/b6 domain-containing protein [Gammaproteobacteria bacterium]